MSNIDNYKNKLRELAINNMSSDGAHDILHLDRVWQNSCSIIENDLLNPDLVVVCAACYLHDIKQYKKNDANNYKSSAMAADYAAKLLSNHFAELSQEQIDKVKHATQAHSFSANIQPCSLEAKIVQDADRLDSLGAIGIARLFYTAGIIGSQLYCAKKHELNDKEYALDHFYKKLFNLPKLMHTNYAKELAYERLEFIKLYLKQLALETRINQNENVVLD